MTRMTSLWQEEELASFARKAAADFKANPKWWTVGDMEPGTLLAMRWGADNDCVRIVRLDECFEHVVFQQIIK